MPVGTDRSMSKEIPETIILDAQRMAYERKESVAKLRTIAESKAKDLQMAEQDVGIAEIQLRETLDFLQEHNADAHEDWYAELGVKRI